MTDSLSRPLYISLAAHFGLLSLFFLKMTFFPVQPIEIKRAIRVDLVGMPEKVKEPKPVATKEPKKVAPKKPAPKVEKKVEAKKPAPKKPPKVVTKKKDSKKIEKSQESAINRLKALAALEKIKQEAVAAEVETKGNQVSKGNSLTGLEQIEYDRYFDQVEQLLYSHWMLPEWLINAGLRAQALVLVDESGHVIKKEIIKSSGDPTFDAHVMAAIEKAAPFPAPPARLQGVLADQGFVFNFPE